MVFLQEIEKGVSSHFPSQAEVPSRKFLLGLYLYIIAKNYLKPEGAAYPKTHNLNVSQTRSCSFGKISWYRSRLMCPTGRVRAASLPEGVEEV